MSYPVNSLRDFYQWVKTRVPNETYDYTNRMNCAIARYCRERGVEYESSSRDHISRQHHLELVAQHAEINPMPIKTMRDLRIAIEYQLR